MIQVTWWRRSPAKLKPNTAACTQFHSRFGSSLFELSGDMATRAITQPPPAGCGIQWQVEGDWAGMWTDYEPEFSTLLEDHFQTQSQEKFIYRPKDTVIFHYYPCSYVQENTETQKRRAMRRVFVDLVVQEWTAKELMPRIKEHNTKHHSLAASHTRTGGHRARSTSRTRSSPRAGDRSASASRM
jgi:hypothetical protein